MEILQQVLSLIIGVGSSALDIVTLCAVFVLEAAKTLHTTMPRLEGLLAGFGLALAMKYRDKYVVAKVLSAPLKIALDGLGYVRGQAARLIRRVFSEIKRPFTWLSGRGRWFYEALKGALRSLRAKLSRTKD
jgi:hypothetical protein